MSPRSLSKRVGAAEALRTMKRAHRSITVGVCILVASLLLALLGGYLGSLELTVFSLILGIGGAVVAIRGMVEFLAEVY